MVRVDHLHLFNNQAQETLLDKRLRRLGGTLYTRCFTPGPDTPRSLACLQTGLLPYANGCDTRIKWPKFFVKEGVSTLWDNVVKRGYRVNLCNNEHEVDTGFFKYGANEGINVCYRPESFVNEMVFEDDSLSFIGTPDMHAAIIDYHASEYGFKKGDQLVNSFFNKYLPDDFISQFDYTFIFSDHGYQTEDESNRMKSKLELLDSGRNQLLLFIHKKTDNGVTKDNRLASLVDMFATIEDITGGIDMRHGFSLLKDAQRSILHIEDHQDFRVYPEIMIKQWRVISDDYDIRTDIYQTIDKNGVPADLKLIDEYLRENSPKYADYYKQLEVWKAYSILAAEDNSTYYEGSKRKGTIKMPYYSFRHFLIRLSSLKFVKQLVKHS